jgi:hypothetical protein
MEAQTVIYPALDHAIRSGALLACSADAGKGVPGRLARLWCDQTQLDLALGAGPSLPDALRSLEQDLLSENPVGPRSAGTTAGFAP